MNQMQDQNTSLSYTTSSEISPNQYTQSTSNHSQPVQMTLTWNQETGHFEKNELPMFVCHLCMKTFYNKNALQNHKNMTHDVASNEENVNFNMCAKLEQDFKSVNGFKFIPLNSEEEDQANNGNNIITRKFTEDTSYLIVKADYEDPENFEKNKKSRLDSLDKKTLRNTEKSSVDIRGPFTCTLPSTMCPDLQCQQIFFSCCEYSLHYREEHTKRRKAALRCQVCEKRLDRNTDADINNIKIAPKVHTANAVVLPCRICGMKFTDEAKFEEHNRMMHTKMKPHQCSICFKRFAQLGGLQQHLRMHTGVRPFMCTFCPKAFTQKAGLDQHLRIHTKVKPFKCVVCSKCFSQSVHLRQHMRTHTNIQPFECSVCLKRFKQRSHLNFHLRSHMNEAGIAAAERYEEAMRQQNEIDFFNLTNLQHVQDGETLYYAAELATAAQNTNINLPNTFAGQSQSLPVIQDDDVSV